MDISIISEGLNKLYKKLELWAESTIEMLPNLLLGLLVFIFFWALSKWVRKLMYTLFDKTHFNESVKNLLANTCRIIVICLGFVLTLAILELQKTVFSLLAGVGVIGLALGFAFQDLAANFISGIMLAVRAPINIGDVVKINDILGTVENIRLRDTIIRNFSGQEIFIPNKDFTSNFFTNYSSYGKRRIKVEVGIGYEDDPDEGVQIVKKALSSVKGILHDPAPEAFIGELAGSSVNLFGHIWIEYPGENFFQVQSDAIKAVKKHLEDAGFNIPFPIRTLDLPSELTKSLSNLNSQSRTNMREANV